MSRNRTIKNRHATVNKNRYPSVIKYVESITEWRMWPGKIVDGEMFVELHGHLIPEEEFLELRPMPSVSNFRSDLTNVDGTATSLL